MNEYRLTLREISPALADRVEQEAKRTAALAALPPMSVEEIKMSGKRWGALHGYTGRSGGMVYSPADLPVCQGWHAFFRKNKVRIALDVAAGTFKLSRSSK